MKKKYRIRKSTEFQQIIRKGGKWVSSSFVFYFVPKKEEEARFGVSLSKKIGNAVQRNLYKRRVRMMVHELVDFAEFPCDGIIIVRFGFKERSYAANKNSLEKLLNKAIIM